VRSAWSLSDGCHNQPIEKIPPQQPTGFINAIQMLSTKATHNAHRASDLDVLALALFSRRSRVCVSHVAARYTFFFHTGHGRGQADRERRDHEGLRRCSASGSGRHCKALVRLAARIYTLTPRLDSCSQLRDPPALLCGAVSKRSGTLKKNQRESNLQEERHQ
jgi:hypothetical protein